MSDLNYVDGGFVHEDLDPRARARRGEKSSSSTGFRPGTEIWQASRPVRQSVEAYRAALPEHLARHRGDASALKSFRTEFPMYVRAVAVDDRNKEHVAFAWH